MTRKLNVNTVNYLLVALVAIVLLVNVITLSSVNTIVKGDSPPTPSGQDVVPEDIDIQLVAIEPTDCEECPDLEEVIQGLIDAGAVVLSDHRIVSQDSAEGKALIEKYSFTELPALVLTGDIDKLPDSPDVERASDAILIRELPPPFVDVATGRVGGFVNIIYLTAPDCTECEDITVIGEQLPEAGVWVGEEEEIVWDSPEGKVLVDKYNITKVPTLIFSEDAKYYEELVFAWDTAGTIDDGEYVLRSLLPPFYDIEQKKVRGTVTAIYLDDESCSDCYDPKEHEEILETNFGMKFSSDKTLDVASVDGKALIKKYGIVNVPTILVQGDTAAYEAVISTWDQVGIVHDDGTLVFTELDLFDWTFISLDAEDVNDVMEDDGTEEPSMDVEDADLADILNQGLQ